MAEYISRETMIKLVRSMAENAETNGFMHDREVIECVMTTLVCVPLVDVAPVVHGKWLNFYNDFSCAECDRCGTIFEVTDNETDEGLWNAFKLSYKYCPKCGAKMDGGA